MNRTALPTPSSRPVTVVLDEASALPRANPRAAGLIAALLQQYRRPGPVRGALVRDRQHTTPDAFGADA
ncbi:hypothetical protein AB0467_28410 [Streptomyces sp. NPDC052095]|uniref:hypothetical protein n=1 Tax=unclassified Streptomyces TaxID=2593676 RepID=UPI00344CA5FB